MAVAPDGFVGRCDVVEPRRVNRRWPDHVKAEIVAGTACAEKAQAGMDTDRKRRNHLSKSRSAAQGLWPAP
jgi:hypothetical protein